MLPVEYERGNVVSFVFAEREYYRAWKDFLAVFPQPDMVVTDGQTGLCLALAELWAEVPRQRCIAHLSRETGKKLHSCINTEAGREPNALREEIVNVKMAAQRWRNARKLLETDAVIRESTRTKHCAPTTLTCTKRCRLCLFTCITKTDNAQREYWKTESTPPCATSRAATAACPSPASRRLSPTFSSPNARKKQHVLILNPFGEVFGFFFLFLAQLSAKFRYLTFVARLGFFRHCAKIITQGRYYGNTVW